MTLPDYEISRSGLSAKQYKNLSANAGRQALPLVRQIYVLNNCQHILK